MPKYEIYKNNQWFDLCKCSVFKSGQEYKYNKDNIQIYKDGQWHKITCQEDLLYIRPSAPTMNSNNTEVLIVNKTNNLNSTQPDRILTTYKDNDDFAPKRIINDRSDIPSLNDSSLVTTLGSGVYFPNISKYLYGCLPDRSGTSSRKGSAMGLYYFNQNLTFDRFVRPDNYAGDSVENSRDTRTGNNISSIVQVTMVKNDVLIYQPYRHRLLIDTQANVANYTDEVPISSGFSLNFMTTVNNQTINMASVTTAGGGAGQWVLLPTLNIMVFARRNARLTSSSGAMSLVLFFNYSLWDTQSNFENSLLGYYVINNSEKYVSPLSDTSSLGNDLILTDSGPEQLIRFNLSSMGNNGSNITYNSANSAEIADSFFSDNTRYPLPNFFETFSDGINVRCDKINDIAYVTNSSQNRVRKVVL